MTSLPSRPAFRKEPDQLRRSIEEMDATLGQRLAARPWIPKALRGPALFALDNAAKRASLDTDDPGIAVDLERAACLQAALFAALTAGAGTSIEAPLPGSDDVVRVTGAAPDPGIGEPHYWRNCLLAALAVRHQRATAMLAGVPLALLRQLAPTYSEWWYLECQALQALALGRADAAERLVAAARAADPDAVDPVGRDWVMDVLTPELQLGFRALDRDQAGFDTWMVVAIKGHHHYYQSRNDPGRKKEALSQLALAPLAMACIAHDRGMRTNIVTDYLPRGLIER